jgi:hypothetical protein
MANIQDIPAPVPPRKDGMDYLKELSGVILRQIDDLRANATAARRDAALQSNRADSYESAALQLEREFERWAERSPQTSCLIRG